MPAIAVAEQVVDAPTSVAFSEFIDYAHWDLWMPSRFAPVRGPARRLQVGDRFKVSLNPRLRLSLELEVIRIRPGKEICWRGGPALLLQGEHSFLFAQAEGDAARTRVRSEEPLTGMLARGPLAAPIERAFAGVGALILTRFAEHLARHTRLASAE